MPAMPSPTRKQKNHAFVFSKTSYRIATNNCIEHADHFTIRSLSLTLLGALVAPRSESPLSLSFVLCLLLIVFNQGSTVPPIL